MQSTQSNREKSFVIRVSGEFHEQVKEAAWRDRTNVSELIRTLLEKHIAKQARRSA